MPADDYRSQSPETISVRAGSDPAVQHGAVNPPVYHASTIIFPTVRALEAAAAARFAGIRYGRYGTPTTHALEEAIAQLEGGAGAMVLPSGLAAASVALLACVDHGDHVLMTDSVYGPTRGLARGLLTRFGVETTFYDPLIGSGIAELIRPNTRVVYLESPGSLTFEVQDVPAIARAAHDAGLLVLLDNTWATPLLFRPFEHGVDISIHAATKYIVGHSDAMLGIIDCNAATLERVRSTWAELGMTAGPDDVYLGLRGLRTLAARLERHHRSAMMLANWLLRQPEVEEVIYPALPGSRGHELWLRDFRGASGLFSVVFKPIAKAKVDAMLDGMKLFKMGWSWGGFESLILPISPQSVRTATNWHGVGPCLRLHVGLEDPQDLIADLQHGLRHLADDPLDAQPEIGDGTGRL